MVDAFDNAGMFLIQIIFGLYIWVLLLRLLLQWLGASYHNPICQTLVKFTDPVIKPLRKVLPSIKRFELGILVLAFALNFAKWLLIIALTPQHMPSIVGLLILSAGDILNQIINIFFYAIIIQAIMSWFIRSYNPVLEILFCITEPILSIFRKFIPLIGGMDISPIPALIILKLISILVATPIMNLGAAFIGAGG